MPAEFTAVVVFADTLLIQEHVTFEDALFNIPAAFAHEPGFLGASVVPAGRKPAALAHYLEVLQEVPVS